MELQNRGDSSLPVGKVSRVRVGDMVILVAGMATSCGYLPDFFCGTLCSLARVKIPKHIIGIVPVGKVPGIIADMVVLVAGMSTHCRYFSDLLCRTTYSLAIYRLQSLVS
jgi:hypothetical protein